MLAHSIRHLQRRLLQNLSVSVPSPFQLSQRRPASNFPAPDTKRSDLLKTSDHMKTIVRRRELRHAYPEFLPDPNPAFRNPIREKLERRDMLLRRQIVDLPEFYAGSIVAVTVADPNIGLGTPVTKENAGKVYEKKTR